MKEPFRQGTACVHCGIIPGGDLLRLNILIEGSAFRKIPRGDVTDI